MNDVLIQSCLLVEALGEVSLGENLFELNNNFV